jgi:hypothetical protein
MHARLWAPPRRQHRSVKKGYLTEHTALSLLRKPDRKLCVLHTKTRQEYFVTPDGGPVSDVVARRIIERPDIWPDDAGLLADHPQSWRLGRRR